MTQHLTDAQLERFVDADLEESVAVSVAEHLDHCPHCATKAARAEPLAGAFAEFQDPELPPDLIDHILARAGEAMEVASRPALLRPELWAAGGLLAAAALLLALTGGLTPWMAEFGVSVRAAMVGGEVLLTSSPLSAHTIALGASAAIVLSALVVFLRQRNRRR